MLIYVRSLRRWAVAANACHCVSFWLARCARAGCKGSEMELALIYVRSLCRWAVAANALCEFFVGSLCYRGGCKGSETEHCANLRSLAVPLWAVATNACVSFSRERLSEGFFKKKEV